MDDDTVANVGAENTLPGVIDLCYSGTIPLLCAEFEHLLGLGEAAGRRAGKGAPVPGQREHCDWERFSALLGRGKDCQAHLARPGQRATPPADAQRLRQILSSQPTDTNDTRPATEHGLIAVGSHVGLTTRQPDRPRDRGKIIELELDVPTLLDDSARDRHVNDVAAEAAKVLRNNDADSDVVIRTSRTLKLAKMRRGSLMIARTVSAALGRHGA
jgi:Nucleotide-binding C-terminal domain